MNTSSIERIKQAIFSVVVKRKDRGATEDQLTSYLIWLKNGTWRNNDVIKDYIDGLLNGIQMSK